MQSLMYTLFRFLAGLPLPWMQRLGAGLGWLVWAAAPAYRQRLRRHLAAAALPDDPTRAAVAAAGCMVAELPWLWLRAPDCSVLPQVQWQGAECFERAITAGHGVLVLTPHLGVWEMVPQALSERYGPQYGALVGLYRPARLAWLGALMARARNRRWLVALPTGVAGVRGVVKALRSGGYSLLLPDQVPPLGQGVWADFFGQPAYTMTLPARLLQATQATLLLAWCERRRPGAGFVMHLEPWSGPDLADRSLDPQMAALAVNLAMQQLIERCPSQYLWSYARYKQPRVEA